jgi:hypothetical protein
MTCAPQLTITGFGVSPTTRPSTKRRCPPLLSGVFTVPWVGPKSDVALGVGRIGGLGAWATESATASGAVGGTDAIGDADALGESAGDVRATEAVADD